MVLRVVNLHDLAADSRFKLPVAVFEVGQDRGCPGRGRRGKKASGGDDATRRVASDSVQRGEQTTAGWYTFLPSDRQL